MVNAYDDFLGAFTFGGWYGVVRWRAECSAPDPATAREPDPKHMLFLSFFLLVFSLGRGPVGSVLLL